MVKTVVEDGRPASMDTSVWQRLPQDLVETVLLFLPPSSQARFRSVCKRWRKLIKSATFQEESSGLRNDAGLLCFVQPPGLNHKSDSPLCLPGELTVKSLKMHRLNVDMPGLMIPSNSHLSCRVFSHGSLVVLVSWNWRSRVHAAIRCWVLDFANQSWLELPPHMVVLGVSGSTWKVWVAGSDTNNFQLFLTIKMYDPKSYTLHTYSATSTTWTTVDTPWPQEAWPPGIEPAWCAISKLGYILVAIGDGYGDRVWLWEGTSSASPPKLTPLPRERRIRILSHPDTDAVFGITRFGELEWFKLFRLEGTSGQWKWKWKCVVPGLPQGLLLDGGNGFKIHRAKIVGNKVLIEVWLKTEVCCSFRGCLFLTYHILSGCYEWLSALSKQEFEWKSTAWAVLGLMDATAFFKHESRVECY